MTVHPIVAIGHPLSLQREMLMRHLCDKALQALQCGSCTMQDGQGEQLASVAELSTEASIKAPVLSEAVGLAFNSLQTLTCHIPNPRVPTPRSVSCKN